MKNKHLFRLILTFSISFLAAAQSAIFAQTTTDFSKNIVQKLNTWANLPDEKVYLNFDKAYYSVGEKIWFNGFLADAITHLPDTISQTLYVEISYLETNKIIEKQTLQIVNSRVWGGFFTEKWAAGTYLIRAYTNWMRNAPDDFYFQKKIELLATAETPPQYLAEKKAKFDVQFFPEGGNLVVNLPCNVAFKALDVSTGKGVKVMGKIVNDSGDSLAKIQDDFSGIGRFSLKPVLGKKYLAQLTFPDGSQQNFDLPTAQNEGMALTLDNSRPEQPIRAFVYLNSLSEKMPTAFFALAHVRGQSVFATKIDVTNKDLKTFRFNIPRENLASVEGVVCLTVFDDKGMPLCERLFFHENPNTTRAFFSGE
ncbi:MAG: hypothetical protein HC817_16590 [Saprospiraceae bacterium]|nr:hypothetical protein [Saprospiraceae bacterium]